MRERVGLRTRLKPGCEQRHEEAHKAVWPELPEAAHDYSGAVR